MSLRVLGLVLLAFAGAAAPASAQPSQDAGESPAVLVQVRPAVVPPGATVTITGSAYATDPNSYNATVSPPAGGAEPLRIALQSNGGYQGEFRNTRQTGTYTVRIAVKGAKIPGTAQFTVVQPAAYQASVAQDFEGDIDKAAELGKAIDAAFAKIPDSPAKRQFQDKLQAFDRLVSDVVKERSILGDSLKSFDQLRSTMPRTIGELDRRLVKLKSDTQSQEDAVHKDIDAELSKSGKDNVICEQIEIVNEGINLMSALFNFVGGPASAVMGFAGDAVAAKGGGLAQESTASMLGGDVVQELIKESPVAEKTFTEAVRGARYVNFKRLTTLDAHKIFTDLSGFIAQGVFEMYCQKFEGPFKATMDARFSGGDELRLWWVYRSEIEGTLTLRYAKETSGTAVQVNGEFMGQATKLKMTYEDAIMVLLPNMAKTGSTIKKFVVDPVTLPYALRPEFEGKIVAHNVTPYSFKVPVTGQLVDGKLSLQLGSAIADYTANTRVVYLMYGPLLAFPVISGASFPYKDAHFILLRAMNGENVDFTVTTDKKKMMFTRDFENERNTMTTKGTYSLHIKACNPGCK